MAQEEKELRFKEEIKKTHNTFKGFLSPSNVVDYLDMIIDFTEISLERQDKKLEEKRKKIEKQAKFFKSITEISEGLKNRNGKSKRESEEKRLKRLEKSKFFDRNI